MLAQSVINYLELEGIPTKVTSARKLFMDIMLDERRGDSLPQHISHINNLYPDMKERLKPILKSTKDLKQGINYSNLLQPEKEIMDELMRRMNLIVQSGR